MGKGDRAAAALQEPLLGPGSPNNHNDQFARTLTRSLEDIQKSLERQSNEDGLRFGMTPVRRMFCLLSLFDFLLVFLLWIIYAQVGKIARVLTYFLLGRSCQVHIPQKGLQHHDLILQRRKARCNVIHTDQYTVDDTVSYQNSHVLSVFNRQCQCTRFFYIKEKIL